MRKRGNRIFQRRRDVSAHWHAIGKLSPLPASGARKVSIAYHLAAKLLHEGKGHNDQMHQLAYALFGVLQDFASCYPAVQISVRVDIPGEMIAAMSGACRCRAGKRSRCRERRDARHATGESRLPGAFCVRRCGRVRSM